MPNAPLEEGKDFYYNDEGLMVLTEEYHFKRGYCCGNGCLHCPYPQKDLDENQGDSSAF